MSGRTEKVILFSAFRQADLTDLDEIWHDVASPKNFWLTLAHFFCEHKLSVVDISGIF